MRERKYHLRAEIGSAICLPSNDDYSIQIHIGEKIWDAGEALKIKDTWKFKRWNKRFAETFTS